jgi:predicted S18 family serine protease
MPTLTPTQLEKLRWSAQSWTEILAENMRRLEDTLLYVTYMQDVNESGLADGDVLQWNEGATEWQMENWKTIFPSTTSTTTTTVTTTTVTTTTVP